MTKSRFKISLKAVKISLFILILVSIVLLLKDVDFKKTLPVLKNMHYGFLIAVFLLSGINIFLFALRWYVLLRVTKKNISFKNVVFATIGGIAINSTGPGKLGVPAKALLIKKMEGLEVNQSIPSLMMELFFEFLSLGVLFVVSALVIGMFEVLVKFVSEILTFNNLLIISGLLLIVVVLGFVFRHKIFENDFIKKMLLTFRKMFAKKEIFVIVLIISVINLLISFWGDLLLFKSLRQDIPYSFIIFSSAFSTIAGILSPLPSGIGVWELTRAYLFKTYFNIGELAVIMTLMRRLLTFGVLGVLYVINLALKSNKKYITTLDKSNVELYQEKLLN